MAEALQALQGNGKEYFMKKILVAGFLFLSFVYSFGNAFAYTSPGRPSGFVNDFADVLSSETEQTLNGQLTAFARDESNEISVVTISSLGDETVESYSEQLFQEWGIGTAKQDNGVLLLIAPNDREVRIEVGYGLEGALTDLETQLIIKQTLIPGFKEGRYDEVVVVAVNQMIEATKGEYQGYAPDSVERFMDRHQNLVFLIFWLLFIGAGQLLSAMIRATSRSRAIWPGGAVGAIGGLVIAAMVGVALGLALAYIMAGTALGLLVDYLLSRHPAVNKWGKDLGRGKRVGGGFWGFFGGGGGGGGFGGFGGGLSGGGGSSGRW